MTAPLHLNRQWKYKISKAFSLLSSLKKCWTTFRKTAHSFYLHSAEAYSNQGECKWKIMALTQDRWHESAFFLSSWSGCQDFLWDPGCALKQTDGANAVEKQQLIGVDSAWSFLTSTWALQSSIPSVVRSSAPMKTFTMSLNPVPMATCSLLCSSDAEENLQEKFLGVV